ncbi:MAG: permease-like cell division protein FtsX [Gammaproteobacteria bacterium]|jgi:cell division transport system permease protein
MNRHEEILHENAQRARPGLTTVLKTYALRHAQVFFYSLGQLWRAPFAMLMTSAVIGIALALPTGLHLLLKNAEVLSGGWDGIAKISLFLKTSVSDAQASQLGQRLRSLPQVANVDFISREQALTEFKRQSGFGDALDALDDNPLPAVLVVTPKLQDNSSQAIQSLARQLKQNSAVEYAQLDRRWLQRLYGIMHIIGRGVLILGAALALAVLLVVGNTIRLAIQNRREEIVVIKLIGGTDAFIRRPFLYTGFWYGLIGGLIALILVELALWLINGPVENLAGLYASHFALHNLDAGSIFTLLLLSIVLGLGGSWLAVGRHLREIEPR